MTKRAPTRTLVYKKCEECGGAFSSPSTNKKLLKRRFCSTACARLNNGKNNKGSKRSDLFKQLLSKKLEGSGNPFYGKSHSQEAKIKMSQAKAGLPSKRKGKKQPSTAGDLNPAKRQEVRMKISKALSVGGGGRHACCKGSLNPNHGNGAKIARDKNPAWIDGRSYGEYGPEYSRALKAKIKKRDNFTCAVCGGRGVAVHHIDYDKKNNNQDNLVTLCRSCHGKTGFSRNEWVLFFKSKSEGCTNGRC